MAGSRVKVNPDGTMQMPSEKHLRETPVRRYNNSWSKVMDDKSDNEFLEHVKVRINYGAMKKTSADYYVNRIDSIIDKLKEI